MIYDLNLFYKSANLEKDKELYKFIEKKYGFIKDYKKFNFYQTFLDKLKTFEFKVPADLKSIFDWHFVQHLLACSLSCEYELKIDMSSNQYDIDLIVNVKNSNQNVVKYFSELYDFQIYALFSIFLCEHLNYERMLDEDEIGKENFNNDMMDKIYLWNANVSKTISEQKILRLLN